MDGYTLLAFLAGVVVAGVVGFFVVRNNRKRFEELLAIDPEEKAKDLLKRIKSKF